MLLQFTNKQIFFSVSQCFGDLSPRLRTHLQDLVLINSEDDFVQTVTITPKQLAEVYRSVSGIAEGEARLINGQMKDALLPQLMGLAQNGDEEALEAIGLIQAIDAQNDGVMEAKVLSGKTQILVME